MTTREEINSWLDAHPRHDISGSADLILAWESRPRPESSAELRIAALREALWRAASCTLPRPVKDFVNKALAADDAAKEKEERCESSPESVGGTSGTTASASSGGDAASSGTDGSTHPASTSPTGSGQSASDALPMVAADPATVARRVVEEMVWPGSTLKRAMAMRKTVLRVALAVHAALMPEATRQLTVSRDYWRDLSVRAGDDVCAISKLRDKAEADLSALRARLASAERVVEAARKWQAFGTLEVTDALAAYDTAVKTEVPNP